MALREWDRDTQGTGSIFTMIGGYTNTYLFYYLKEQIYFIHFWMYDTFYN